MLLMNRIIIPVLALLLAACGPELDPDQNLLIQVRSTDRISSNHYADFVVDEAGNTYIASFQKQEGAYDRILILKLSPSGEMLWEIGKNDLGRALAITRNDEGELWVAGRFREKLSWDGHILESEGRSQMFIARINEKGKCTKLVKAEGNPLAFNIHAAGSGAFLLGGIMGKEGGFGNVQASLSAKETSFLAMFSASGACMWIKRLLGNIHRIRSDAAGDFYVGGDFVETFAFGQDTSYTKGPFDQDGFLLKIGQTDSWSRTFGEKGYRKYGYKSYEGVSDISIHGNGPIWTIVRRDNPASYEEETPSKDFFPTDLILLSFSPSGELLDSLRVIEQVRRGHVFRMAQDNHQRLWITGTGRGSFEIGEKSYNYPENQSFLIRLDSTRALDKIIFPEHGPNMLFRVADTWEDRGVLTGHFQSHLYIGSDSLENEGKHELFLYRTKGF